MMYDCIPTMFYMKGEKKYLHRGIKNSQTRAVPASLNRPPIAVLFRRNMAIWFAR